MGSPLQRTRGRIKERFNVRQGLGALTAARAGILTLIFLVADVGTRTGNASSFTVRNDTVEARLTDQRLLQVFYCPARHEPEDCISLNGSTYCKKAEPQERMDFSDCTPMGNPGGYTYPEWQEIQKTCSLLGIIYAPAHDVGMAMIMGSGALGGIASAAVGSAILLFTQGETAQDYQTAQDLMMGLGPSHEVKPGISPRKFVQLVDGLKSCMQVHRTFERAGCEMRENPSLMGLY